MAENKNTRTEPKSKIGLIADSVHGDEIYLK